MKQLCYTIMATTLLAVALDTHAREGAVISGRSAAKQIVLIENKGQVTDQHARPRADIDFSIRAQALDMFVGSGTLYYQFSRPAPNNAREVYRLDMELVGANSTARPVKYNPTSSFENYFLGHTGKNGITNVRSYQRVVYPEIYPGIDWIIYADGKQLKYDFIIHEGADVRDIRIRYNGLTGSSIKESGSLEVNTPFGDIIEDAPVAWTQHDNKRVASRFVARGANEWGFETSPYKGVLVLDPVLQWGTYFGGSQDEGGTYHAGQGNASVTTDENRMVYITSTTKSNNIATIGTHQQTLAGETDVVVAKFHPDGRLLWSTYYGGDKFDFVRDIAADKIGHLYISGSTYSETGISKNGFRNNYNTNVNTAGGGLSDPSHGTNNYLAQFNTDNGQLEWATYYAGKHPTFHYDIEGSLAVDNENNVYLAGTTGQDTGVHTPGAWQEVIGSSGSAYLAKFDSAGNRLWATYYGGYSTAGPTTTGASVATDAAGNVYLIGSTRAGDSIATPNTHKSTITSTTQSDVFIAKFTRDGQRIWGTYYGGTGAEGPSTGGILSVDQAGNVYIAGLTLSATGIATPGAMRTTINTGTGFGGGGGTIQDGFMAKFDSTGQLVWGTYMGPNKMNYSYSTAIDPEGYPWIIGSGGIVTSDTLIHPTPDAHQSVYGGGGDAVIFRLHADSGTLQYSSYYGGNDQDAGQSITFDKHGVMYLLGYTRSVSGIATTTPNVFHQFIEGGADLFLAKFINLYAGDADTLVCPEASFFVPYTPPTEFNTGNTFTVELSDNNGDFSNPVIIGTDASNSTNPIESIIPAGTATGGGYKIRIQSTDPALTSNEVSISVNQINTPAEITVNDYTLSTTVPYTSYQWYKNGDSIPGATNATYEVTENADYTVKVHDQNGCKDSSDKYTVNNVSIKNTDGILKISVYPNPAHDVLYIKTSASAFITISGIDGREMIPTFKTKEGVNPINTSYLASGVYLIRITDDLGNALQIEKFVKADK